MSVPGFSEIARYRAELPRLQSVYVTRDLIGRYRRIANVLQAQLRAVANAKPFTVLDIGAYDRAFGRALVKTGLPCRYFSVDADTSMPHDFYDLADVTGTFDFVAMFELIEHLTYEQVDCLLHKVFELLTPGGRVFISTPNPFHPTRYVSDVSHKQHWPPDDLYALLRHVGFSKDDIQMYGVIYTPPSIYRATISHIRNVLWRVLGIDYRGGILAIALKRTK